MYMDSMANSQGDNEDKRFFGAFSFHLDILPLGFPSTQSTIVAMQLS